MADSVPVSRASFSSRRAAGDRSPRRQRGISYESSQPLADVTKAGTYESRNPYPKTRLGDTFESAKGDYQRRQTRTYRGTYETLLVDVGEGKERLFAVGPHDPEAARKAAHAPANESRAKGGNLETSPVLRRVPLNRGLVGAQQLQGIVVDLRRYLVAQGVRLQAAKDPSEIRQIAEELRSRIIGTDWAAAQRRIEEEDANVERGIR